MSEGRSWNTFLYAINHVPLLCVSKLLGRQAAFSVECACSHRVTHIQATNAPAYVQLLNLAFFVVSKLVQPGISLT